jgi:hypothetical protein
VKRREFITLLGGAAARRSRGASRRALSSPQVFVASGCWDNGGAEGRAEFNGANPKRTHEKPLL